MSKSVCHEFHEEVEYTKSVSFRRRSAPLAALSVNLAVALLKERRSVNCDSTSLS